MTAIALLTGVILAGSIATGIVGFTTAPRPKQPTALKPRSRWLRRWDSLTRQDRLRLLAGLIGGLVIYLVNGWILALVLVPIAVAGLPVLLSAPRGGPDLAMLAALEEWTRALAGLLQAGQGLEQAITVSLRSVPDVIRDQVAALVSRIGTGWSTEEALRFFADDLGEGAGGVNDTIAADLILAARTRGSGVTIMMTSLATAVAEQVRAMRAVEADRAKPRWAARAVTVISVVVLAAASFAGPFAEPYRTPVGSVIFLVLLACFIGALVWMRQITVGEPVPRFIGRDVRAEVAR